MILYKLHYIALREKTNIILKKDLEITGSLVSKSLQRQFSNTSITRSAAIAKQGFRGVIQMVGAQ
jgi:hypothetical protein